MCSNHFYLFSLALLISLKFTFICVVSWSLASLIRTIPRPAIIRISEDFLYNAATEAQKSVEEARRRRLEKLSASKLQTDDVRAWTRMCCIFFSPLLQNICYVWPALSTNSMRGSHTAPVPLPSDEITHRCYQHNKGA